MSWLDIAERNDAAYNGNLAEGDPEYALICRDLPTTVQPPAAPAHDSQQYTSSEDILTDVRQ